MRLRLIALVGALVAFALPASAGAEAHRGSACTTAHTATHCAPRWR